MKANAGTGKRAVEMQPPPAAAHGSGVEAGRDHAGEGLGICRGEHGGAVLHAHDNRAVQIGDVGMEVAKLVAPIVAGEGIETAVATGAKAAAEHEGFDFHGANFCKWQHRVPPQALDENAVLRDDVAANDERQGTEWNEQHGGDGELTCGQRGQADKSGKLLAEGEHESHAQCHQGRENGDDEQGPAPGGFEVMVSHDVADFAL